MYRDPRCRLLAFAVVLLVAFLATRAESGVSAYGLHGGEADLRRTVVDWSLADREDNEDYLECLRRRDSGQMECGELCYWRECMVCANVCTLDCRGLGECWCDCLDCPDPDKTELGVVPSPVDRYVSDDQSVVGVEGGVLGGVPGVNYSPFPQGGEPTPVPQLECEDYPTCLEEYEIELLVACDDQEGVECDPKVLDEDFPACEEDESGTWKFCANFGRDDVRKDGDAYVQPYAFHWELEFKNDYLEEIAEVTPSITHLSEDFKFDCSVRWTTASGGPIPGVVSGSWPDRCVMGHNTLRRRGFYAEATWCDTGDPSCKCPDSNPNCNNGRLGGHQLWPVGSYKVELLVDDEVIEDHEFEVVEFPRPTKWPLQHPPDIPADHPNPAVMPYYESLGDWPAGLTYGPSYYLDRLDCIAEDLCSVRHPWEYPLPWGSSLVDFDFPPYWGDYSPDIGAAGTAPYPELHPGFDWTYPWCPRLDWCYQGQASTEGQGDPCEEDIYKCDYCEAVCPDPWELCDDKCECGCSDCGCWEDRACRWTVSCGGCLEWTWRALGVIGSGAGRERPVPLPNSLPGRVPRPQPAPPSTPGPVGGTDEQQREYRIALGYDQYPINFGSGFAVRNPEGDFRNESPAPGQSEIWQRDNTELFNMARDAHMLVDNYMGMTVRCQGKREVTDFIDFEDDAAHHWFQAAGDFPWMNPGAALPEFVERVRTSDRIDELAVMATAQPDQARIDHMMVQVRECEVEFREKVRDAFSPDMTMTEVGELMDEVRETCQDYLGFWGPVMSSGPTGDFCPDLASGVHEEGFEYRLLNGDGYPVFANDWELIESRGIPLLRDEHGELVLSDDLRYAVSAEDNQPVVFIDFVFEEDTLLVHWTPGPRGSGVAGGVAGGLNYGFTTDVITPRKAVLPQQAGAALPAFPSSRPNPMLPVDESLCWMFDGQVGWRFFDDARTPEPLLESQETDLQWQERIGWLHSPVGSGMGPPPVAAPRDYLPLELPDLSVYQYWTLSDWFAFNNRRAAEGMLLIEVYSSGGVLRPRDFVVEYFGGPANNLPVTLASAGVGAQGVRYFGAETDHPTQGPRFQERFMGYVDSRPAPAFVVSWPVGPESEGYAYDGPETVEDAAVLEGLVNSEGGPIWGVMPVSENWDYGPAGTVRVDPFSYNMFVQHYMERIDRDFKQVEPDEDDRRGDYEPCNEDQSSWHNHVVGVGSLVGASGMLEEKMFTVLAKPCWVTYKDAYRVPGLYQVVKPSEGSGLQEERFPVWRYKEVRSGADQPVPSSATSDDTPTAAFDARQCPGGVCEEPGRCVFQDHRGMLRTNFTLQTYPQPVGESMRFLDQHGTQVLRIEDYDRNRYDTLLAIAVDSAQTEERDHFQPLNQADWHLEGNVLVYPRKDGFSTVEARLPWMGYETMPNGFVRYTDRLGYQMEINPALMGGCQPLCPYYYPRRVVTENPGDEDQVYLRAVTRHMGYTGGYESRYNVGLWGTTPGFVFPQFQAGRDGSVPADPDAIGGINECHYFGDGMVTCGRYPDSTGHQGFNYDLPYPYCPPLIFEGMATMEQYVLPPWDYVAPEDDLDREATDSDRDILVEFYDSLHGDEWVNTRNWLSDRPIGEWHGVTAVGDTVIAIELTHNGLRGELPERFGELTQLVSLDLAYNKIEGEFPESMRDLELLTYLDLSNNVLVMTGSMLQEFAQSWEFLEELDMGFNQLYGSYPAFFYPEVIKSIDLSHNRIGGGGKGVPWSHWNDPYRALLTDDSALIRLELKGNSIGLRCVKDELEEGVPFTDVNQLGLGLCSEKPDDVP